MNTQIEEMLDELDAAILTGDSFYSFKALNILEDYLERWMREVKNIKETFLELNLKRCPFCGERMEIHIEKENGEHPGEKWFSINHSCLVDIESHQKGGTLSDFIKNLNKRVE